MFPIALDLTKISVLLVGSGDGLRRKQEKLAEAKATKVTILDNRLPEAADIQAVLVVLVTGLPRAQAEPIALAARAAGKLVNVEDINDLCDFYFTANVRRGDLLISVSTGGASPTLSRKVRDYIGRIFGAEWESHTREIAEYRRAMKAEGKSIGHVLKASEVFLAEKGWLK